MDVDVDVPSGLWCDLVEGRWSLVARFESHGRRVLVACRNDPATRPSHQLSDLERRVVALLAGGHSLKLCACEVGRAESTIHSLAASAMRKMGIESRAALVELYAVLISSRTPRRCLPEQLLMVPSAAAPNFQD
jgi:DNA-binding CsgD family transcriptional regulator